MLSQTLSASLLGVDGVLVRVEVDVAFGLPGLTIVGLAGSAVQEARERVRSALRNSGFELPARRITVNLSPADLPKEGTAFDLAIAVGVLSASNQLRAEDPSTALIAELALDGRLQPIAGAMALVAAAREAGVADVVVAVGNAAEAAAVRGIRVRPAATLGLVVRHLAGLDELSPAGPTPLPEPEPAHDLPDLGDVIGQPLGRRALEIALAGRHHLALCGPPGVGKTLLLQCAPGLDPPLEEDEAIEVGRIYSAAGLVDRRKPLVRARPFRAPHHTVSKEALVGGGPRVRPGEASLAHRGVLFLDETLQFRADALDALRQPLDSGSVTIARVEGALSLPARFLLLAAFNPCPCGWLGTRGDACRCDPASARRYAARLSGPLRDRLDLFVRMEAPRGADGGDGAEPSRLVAGRVAAALQRQRERQASVNAELPLGAPELDAALTARGRATLQARARRFRLSPRRVQRTLRVAQTIADLAGSGSIDADHLDEALHYRPERAAA